MSQTNRKYRLLDLQLLGNDERGSSYAFHTRKTDGFLLATRTKGAVSGNHWHEGKSSTKNPEILLLVSGKMLLEITDLETQHQYSETIEGPKLVEIDAMALHTLTSLEDCTFLEFNSLEEHKADTKYPS